MDQQSDLSIPVAAASDVAAAPLHPRKAWSEPTLVKLAAGQAELGAAAIYVDAHFGS